MRHQHSALAGRQRDNTLALVSVISWVILLGAPAAFLAVPLTLLILAAVKVLYVEPARREPAAHDK